MRLTDARLALVMAVAIAPLASAQAPGAAAASAGATSRAVTLSTEFDRWAEALMTEWHIPGMAVGAIKNGKVVLLKGYGFRNVEERLPVTGQTLMAIGSNSKSFTVVLMGQLVDEGKLDWDKPVRHYLPDFRLHDDYATEHMRVKDLVTHVSGLPRHDDIWYGRSTTRQQIYDRLRYLEPSTSLRGRWQYNNLMFITAGHLVERVAGKPWEALVRERIFAPLQMARANTSTNDMPGSGDFSHPYRSTDGQVERIPFRNIDNAGPAGSINASVDEMLHYIQMHISGGQWNGRRILSAKNALKMQSPQSVVGESMEDPELGPETYGLATWVSSYRGHKWVQHGGGIDGFISQMAWLPHDSIGVMVLTNMGGDPNPVPNTVVRRVFDDLLGLQPIDWNARTRVSVARGRAAADSARAKLEAERVAGTSPSHPLRDYTGTFHHDGYGTFEIVERNGGLVVQVDGFSLPIDHYHYDAFALDPRKVVGAPFSGLIQFMTATNGKVDRVAVPLEPAVAPIEFTRQ